MARMPSGLRKAAGGCRDPFRRDRAKVAAAPVVVLTQEERDAAYEENQARIGAFIERTTADFHKYVDGVRQSKALARIVDAEARVAVEGDTDLNHDNVEG